MQSLPSLIGRTVKYQFDHLFQTVTFQAKIVSVADGVIRARIPKSVMALPFPPFGKDKNTILFPVNSKTLSAVK